MPQVSDSGAAAYDDGKFRGRVRFQKQCMFPKSKDASVLNFSAVVLRMPLVVQMNWPGPMHLVTSM